VISKWLYVWMTAIILAALSMCPAATVSIAWEPPESTNDIAGYRVYVGSASLQYDRSIDVGMALTATVPDIGTNANTHFAVTAYNTYGNESEYSDEMVWDVEGYLRKPGKPTKLKFIDILKAWFKQWFN